MNANPERSSSSRNSRAARTIVFAAARACPDATRLFFGGSDFKVYEVDLAADEARAEGAGRPRELRHRRGAGGQDARLRRLRRQADLVGHRRRARSIRTVDGPREVDPPRRRDARTASSSPAWPTTWSAGSGTPRPASCVHELRGHEEKTPHHFPSMLYAVRLLARRQAPRDRRQGRPRRRLGRRRRASRSATLEAPVMYTWDPVQRLHSIGGIRSLAFSPDGKHAGRRRHRQDRQHRPPRRPRPASRSSTGRPQKRLTEYVGDKSKGLVNRLEFAPDGSWLLAAGGANEASCCCSSNTSAK